MRLCYITQHVAELSEGMRTLAVCETVWNDGSVAVMCSFALLDDVGDRGQSINCADVLEKVIR